MYRTAILKPIEDIDDSIDEGYREQLRAMLERPNLQRLEYVHSVEQWVNEPDLTTPALFELIGCSLFEDAELRYALLAEPSCEVRTIKVLQELERLDKIIEMTNRQSQGRGEDGLSWN